jgi:hypothetical protein
MRVREERGHYVLEPVEAPRKIDLNGIAGAIPGLKLLSPEGREFDESPRQWTRLEDRG